MKKEIEYYAKNLKGSDHNRAKIISGLRYLKNVIFEEEIYRVRNIKIELLDDGKPLYSLESDCYGFVTWEKHTIDVLDPKTSYKKETLFSSIIIWI